MMFEVKRALLSVHDKSGIAALARGLRALGVEIVSSGGTARTLRAEGISVRSVEDVTGAPEIFDGRVKTLHPKIHGGILQRRGHARDEVTAAQAGIEPIDLVVVNLYPFDVASRGGDLDHALENIDIGGPAMVRAAAKNFPGVLVVTSASDYDDVLNRLQNGEIDLGFRTRMALRAFRHTARYDAAIALYLERRVESSVLPEESALPLRKMQELRYGENPHQKAAFYADGRNLPLDLSQAQQIQGKELSFNNIADISAALTLVLEMAEPAAVVMKHANPCGCATATTLAAAYEDARRSDPLSAFGSVVALNRELDVTTAEAMRKSFVEAVIAPGFAAEALQRLRKKRALRLLRLPAIRDHAGRELGPLGPEVRAVMGGYLLQERDCGGDAPETWQVASRRQPTTEERAALAFAWKVCRHVKSNAIVVASGTRTLGVGAGQMSRVDSVKIAVAKGHEHGHALDGAVLASDAFFPFRDGLDAAAEAGIQAVIQPGGSKRDAEVIAAADEHGIAMILTGRRHFRH
jgi:phosphoribosylaminoimidazolecarboxamide formyltransferase/IMP cyclohydrolase